MSFNLIVQNNNNMPLLYNTGNFGGNKSINNLPAMPNNVSSPNKTSKNNDKMLNSMMNFPKNLNNNNMNNMLNLNTSNLN